MLEAIALLNLIPARPGILSSDFFRITNLGKGKIHVSVASEIKGEYTIQGQGQWPFAVDFYLDRRVFVPFVVQAASIKSDAPFNFRSDAKSLVVRNGKRGAEYNSAPPLRGYGLEENEATKKIKSRLELTDHARFLIRSALSCAASDHSTPQLTCVYVAPKGGILSIYSTNRTILYQARSKEIVKPETPIPFPLFLVDLLEHPDLVEVQWRESYVALIFPRGKIWQSVSVHARKKFPASTINHYISQGNKLPVLFTIPIQKFVTPLLRLGAYLTAVRRQDWLLTISGEIGGKELKLTSKVPQTVFSERIKLEAPLTRSVSLNWPLDMLLPVFDFLGKKDKGDNIEVRLLKDRSYVSTADVNLVILGQKK